MSIKTGNSGKINAQLASMTQLNTVTPVANTYTLDMQKAPSKMFKITSADANAKTIVFSNVDATAGLIQVCVLLICTTAAAFTHPTGAAFAAGAPTFTTGQSYWLTYDSIDGGVSWAGLCVRRT